MLTCFSGDATVSSWDADSVHCVPLLPYCIPWVNRVVLLQSNHEQLARLVPASATWRAVAVARDPRPAWGKMQATFLCKTVARALERQLPYAHPTYAAKLAHGYDMSTRVSQAVAAFYQVPTASATRHTIEAKSRVRKMWTICPL